MNKGIIIVGMGEGMSMGMARRFASEGFHIGMISRNEAKLQGYQNAFTEEGIPSSFSSADVGSTKELEKAITNLATTMPSVDVLNYNANDGRLKFLLEEDIDDLTHGFRISVGNALTATRLLIPHLKANKGAVLLTGGGTALHPLPELASISLGKAGMRNLAYQLNQVLAKEGIYVGTLTINGAISWESPQHSPAILADKFYEMYQSRKEVEVIF